jgi:phosphohistidine phosphatase
MERTISLMEGKCLIIVRHGKALPREEVLRSGAPGPKADYSRDLIEKGTRQATHLSRILAAAGQRIDLIVSSSADRALETALIVARHLGLESLVESDESFYGCSVGHWLKTLRKRPDTIGSIMVVGHNPEMEMLAMSLGAGDDLVLPTCGTIKLDGVDSWSDLGDKPMQTKVLVVPAETMDKNLDDTELADLWG